MNREILIETVICLIGTWFFLSGFIAVVQLIFQALVTSPYTALPVSGGVFLSPLVEMVIAYFVIRNPRVVTRLLFPH